MTKARHTVAELPQFIRDADELRLSEAERNAIVDAIAENPTAGDLVRGSGGVRKVRGRSRRKRQEQWLAGDVRLRRRAYASFSIGSTEQARARELHGPRGRCDEVHCWADRQSAKGAKKMREDPFKRVMAGLEQALADARGDEAPGIRLHIPAEIDVVSIRKRVGLSQAAFSRRIGVPVSTVRNWEQGRRAPEGPARVLLAMLDRNPHIVEEVLGDAVA